MENIDVNLVEQVIWSILFTVSNMVNILWSQIIVIIPLKCLILMEVNSKFGKQGNKDGEFNEPRYLSVNILKLINNSLRKYKGN